MRGRQWPGHWVGVSGALESRASLWRGRGRSMRALHRTPAYACPPTTHPPPARVLPGGMLTDCVAARWESALERGGMHLSEPEARFFFRQLVSALEYCHANHVAHR